MLVTKPQLDNNVNVPPNVTLKLFKKTLQSCLKLILLNQVNPNGYSIVSLLRTKTVHEDYISIAVH